MDINKIPINQILFTKNLVNLADVEADDILNLIRTAKQYKLMKSVGERKPVLQNKYIACLAKRSFVTGSLAYLIAVKELGGETFLQGLEGSVIDQTLNDTFTLKSLSSLGVSAVVVNTQLEKDAEQTLKFVNIPVISTLSCYTLAIFMTIWESKNALSGLKLAIVADESTEYESIVSGAVKCGMDVNLIVKSVDSVNELIVSSAKPYGEVNVYDSLSEGLCGVDAVFVLKESTITFDSSAMDYAKDDAILLSVVPFNKDVSISTELADSPKSHILEASENLLYVFESVLSLLVK